MSCYSQLKIFPILPALQLREVLGAVWPWWRMFQYLVFVTNHCHLVLSLYSTCIITPPPLYTNFYNIYTKFCCSIMSINLLLLFNIKNWTLKAYNQFQDSDHLLVLYKYPSTSFYSYSSNSFTSTTKSSYSSSLYLRRWCNSTCWMLYSVLLCLRNFGFKMNTKIKGLASV